MEWKDIADTVKGAAPLVATVLGGPAGAAASVIGGIASLFGSEPEPDKIAEAIKADPEAMIKLRQFESQNRTELAKLSIQSATQITLAVNQTMQAESQSDKWWVSAWRPFWGFISGAAFFALVIFVCFLAWEAISTKDPSAIAMIPALVSAFIGLFGVPAAILGIASWHRGKEKRIKAGEVEQPNILQRAMGK